MSQKFKQSPVDQTASDEYPILARCDDNSYGYNDTLTVGRVYAVRCSGQFFHFIDDEGDETDALQSRFTVINEHEPEERGYIVTTEGNYWRSIGHGATHDKSNAHIYKRSDFNSDNRYLRFEPLEQAHPESQPVKEPPAAGTRVRITCEGVVTSGRGVKLDNSNTSAPFTAAEIAAPTFKIEVLEPAKSKATPLKKGEVVVYEGVEGSVIAVTGNEVCLHRDDYGMYIRKISAVTRPSGVPILIEEVAQ